MYIYIYIQLFIFVLRRCVHARIQSPGVWKKTQGTNSRRPTVQPLLETPTVIPTPNFRISRRWKKSWKDKGRQGKASQQELGGGDKFLAASAPARLLELVPPLADRPCKHSYTHIYTYYIIIIENNNNNNNNSIDRFGRIRSIFKPLLLSLI